MLVPTQNSMKPPCTCHGGLGILKMIPRSMRSPGLGDATSTIVPKGSTLVYNVTFTPGWVSADATAASIAAQVAQNVSQNSGISVVGSNASNSAFSLNAAFTLTLSLNQDYTNAAMVKTVLDNAVSAVTGGVVSSNISVTSGPAQGSGDAPAAGLPGAGVTSPAPTASTFDLTTFVETYGGWLVAGVIGFVLLKKVL